MARNSAIEWTDATHNFWYGCRKVSAGCKLCYAERDMTRFGRDFRAVTRAKGFDKPLSWKEPMKVFVCSWSDFFIKAADRWRAEAWDIIRQTPHLTYQILTKRPENIPDRLPEGWWEGWPNVWLGVSAENQKMADLRIPQLLAIPAAVRFVSMEPLLGPIDFLESGYWDWRYTYDYWKAAFPNSAGPPIDWVITGGESDFHDPRPADIDWFRDIRDQCQRAGVPYFHKQMGGSRKIDGAWGGRVLDGRTWDQLPELATDGKLLQRSEEARWRQR